jgi:hypothetical protein
MKKLKLIVNVCKNNSDLLELLTPQICTCEFQPSIVKCLLDCDKCTVENVNKITSNNNLTMIIACMEELQAVKYLLESKKLELHNLFKY